MNFTIKELATELLIQPSSLRKSLVRDGHEQYGLNDTLPEDLAITVIESYTNPAPRRSEETIEAAQSLLGMQPGHTTKKEDTPARPAGINNKEDAAGNIRKLDDIKPFTVSVTRHEIIEEKTDEGHKKVDTNRYIHQKEDFGSKSQGGLKANDDRPTMPVDLPKPNDNRWSNVFVKVVLTIALIWQMHHSAFVVMEISRMTGSPWIEIDGIFFAFSIQFTGLLLTIYEGKRWYLILFAIIEFLINVVYYQPWEEGGNYPLTFLISGTIAFTIFSYVDLYAKTRRNGLANA